MTTRTAIWTCAILGLSACSGDPRPIASAPATPPETTWTITQHGVGNLKLGGALVEPTGGFEDRYHASFYRDKQPLEGFQFDNPPVLAIVEDGPFRTWGTQHVGRSAPEAIETRAIALARAKRFKVAMLVITDPRPETDAGVSVGDVYASFARAYPRAPSPDTFVGLWEQPSCMVNR